MRVIPVSLLALALAACGAPDVVVTVDPADDASVPVERVEPVEPPVEQPPAEPTTEEAQADEGDPAPVDDPADDDDVTPAFIGAACRDDDGCLAGGFCLDDGLGFPHGTCSQTCTRLCPDDDNAPTTFCVNDPDGDAGLCVSRCDVGRLGGDGCREGYRCVSQPRYAEAGVIRDVCWPDNLALPAPTTTTPPPEPDGDDGVCTEADLPLDNAGLVEPAGVGGCPAGMAPIVGLSSCMDRWEAFLEERRPDGSIVPFSPYRHPGSAVVVARSAPGAVPQGYISGHEAKAACERAGKRLCREAEWSRACRGAAGTLYPWGNDRRDGICNDARARHPAVEYFGTSADWIWSRLGHPCINQLDDSVALTGSHEGCVGPSGHFDLMGNVHEWIDDPAGTFRGGFYVDTVRNGAGCTYRTTAHDNGHWDYSTGFRCCAG
jgi:formylglycine-generating enzyme